MAGPWLAALPAIATFASAFMAEQGQEDTNAANQSNAREQMDFQREMSNTAHQREVKDLIAAGLNPMLSAKLGGASTPSGAMSVAQNPKAAGATAGLQAAQSSGLITQIEQTRAQTRLTDATTAKTAAEQAEIEARTPTHSASIQVMQQNVRESEQRITNMIEDIKRLGATTANLNQQTENLKEIIPQIRSTIDNIKAQTRLYGEQTTLAGAHTKLAHGQTASAYASAELAGAQTKESNQRLAANLPALEAALGNLERVAEEMKMPGRAQDEAVADSFIGSLSAVMKALNPFTSIMPTVPIRGTGLKPPTPDRRSWKK